MKTIDVEKMKAFLVSQAPKILSQQPVLFAYLSFIDIDIGIYTAKMSIRDSLDLELSLPLRNWLLMENQKSE